MVIKWVTLNDLERRNVTRLVLRSDEYECPGHRSRVTRGIFLPIDNALKGVCRTLQMTSSSSRGTIPSPPHWHRWPLAHL